MWWPKILSKLICAIFIICFGYGIYSRYLAYDRFGLRAICRQGRLSSIESYVVAQDYV